MSLKYIPIISGIVGITYSIYKLLISGINIVETFNENNCKYEYHYDINGNFLYKKVYNYNTKIEAINRYIEHGTIIETIDRCYDSSYEIGNITEKISYYDKNVDQTR